jgi:hypothetical protein
MYGTVSHAEETVLAIIKVDQADFIPFPSDNIHHTGIDTNPTLGT